VDGLTSTIFEFSAALIPLERPDQCLAFSLFEVSVTFQLFDMTCGLKTLTAQDNVQDDGAIGKTRVKNMRALFPDIPIGSSGNEDPVLRNLSLSV
jgi:hypothetical protein